MPVRAVWDEKHGRFSSAKQASLSDGESDTTAETSAGGLSVASSDWLHAKQSPERFPPSSPEKMELARGESSDRCFDYIQGKYATGGTCQPKIYGYDYWGNTKEVCLGFLKGRCTYGLKCQFLHQAFDPDTQTWREACRDFAKNMCRRGDKCPFLHVDMKKPKLKSKPITAPPSPDTPLPTPLLHQEAPPAPLPGPLDHEAIRRRFEAHADILLTRLDYAVASLGLAGMQGRLSTCEVDSRVYDLLLPPATAARFIAPEYAARFVEVSDLLGSDAPVAQNAEVLMKGFADGLPQKDPYVLLIPNNGRGFIDVMVFVRLHDSGDDGRVISDPRLKDCLNRPRVDAEGSVAMESTSCVPSAVL